MYERILVTLDGSELSEAAIPVAKRLASGTDATINVMTVADLPRARVERVKRTHFVLDPAVYGGGVIKPDFEEAEPQGDPEQSVTSEWEDYIRRVASPLSWPMV